MIRARRFVYDAKSDAVVEVQEQFVEPLAPTFGELHDRTRQEYNQDRAAKASDLRQATLERSERREAAHRRYGDESRWRN